MVIRELQLYNFGVYAGFNEFSFRGKKPIVLIGGMNGRGKTTFLDAVLLALYGSNSFAYKESVYNSYGQYLRSFVNQSDGTLQTHITLEFVVGSAHFDTYRINRAWDGSKQRVSERVQVWKNGSPDDFLTKNWALFIESLMPSGLSNFFFFDGEKIAELAVEETSEQMKESIKMLLGISVVDTLKSDLARVVHRAEKRQTSSMDAATVERLRDERDAALVAVTTAEQELATLRIKRDETNHKIEAKKQEYAAKGGDIYAQRQQLFAQRAAVSSRLDALTERLVADAASELPLGLVRSLLSSIHETAEAEHEQKLLAGTVGKLDRLFEAYQGAKAGEREVIASFIEYIRGSAQSAEEYIFEDLSDSSLSRLKVLLDSRLADTRRDIAQHKIERSNLIKQLNQLDNYLSVEIDEQTINKIFREIKELEQSLIILDVEIRTKEDELRTLNGKSMAASSAFKKSLEEFIKRIDFSDDSERILKYAHMAANILDEYTKRLQARKVSAVAETMTQCYKQLANKTNLIDRIEMDPNTLDLRYVSPEGQEVTRASLSAGEKQLMVISLLWSLALCSKKKLPVIIDTPLSRWDSAHRSSVIQTYFPRASEQTIILSTDTEIDQSYYDLMRPNIGDEFTLIYNDSTKSTSISRGYFPGACT